MVAMDISNVTSDCEAIEFTANETLTPAEHTLLLYPTPILYDSDVCDTEVTNYTYASGGYTIGENIESDTYYGTYDYDMPVTIWGLNLTFIALLVTLGVTGALAFKLLKKK